MKLAGKTALVTGGSGPSADELAAVLNKAGYSVYATDHRGHGETGLNMIEAGQTVRSGNLGRGGVKSVV